MSMKNSNDTTWNRNSDLPICSTVHCIRVYYIFRRSMDVRVVFCDFFFFTSDNFLKEIKDLENPKPELECRAEYINV
jgi:hypothetical protein